MEWIDKWRDSRNKVTIIICAINVIVFIGLTCIGMTESASFMLEHGAMYPPYVIAYQEYYRFFTSLFLHFGIEHLGNNMLLLFIVGSQLEQEIGKIKYVILYICAGLLGNILSFVQSVRTEEFYVSGGASGAVFGVFGGMLWVVLRNNGQMGTLTSNGIVFMVGISLYYGFTSTGIDNLAHLGGLVGGFLLAILLYRRRNRKSNCEYGTFAEF